MKSTKKLTILSATSAEKLAQKFFDCKIKGDLCELNGRQAWYEFKKGNFILTIGSFYDRNKYPTGIFSKNDEVICSVNFESFRGNEK